MLINILLKVVASIIGGEIISSFESDVPWLVKIHNSTTNSICTGIIIEEGWILTAAHCLLDSALTHETGLVDVSNLDVFVNPHQSHDYDDYDDVPQWDKVQIEEFIFFDERWSSNLLFDMAFATLNDVVLLKVRKEQTTNPGVGVDYVAWNDGHYADKNLFHVYGVGCHELNCDVPISWGPKVRMLKQNSNADELFCDAWMTDDQKSNTHCMASLDITKHNAVRPGDDGGPVFRYYRGYHILVGIVTGARDPIPVNGWAENYVGSNFTWTKEINHWMVDTIMGRASN